MQLALVRLVQIIGEAASRVSDDLRQRHPEIPRRHVVGIRNRVVHGYYEVDLDLLWDVVTLDIPKLRAQLAAIPDEE